MPVLFVRIGIVKHSDENALIDKKHSQCVTVELGKQFSTRLVPKIILQLALKSRATSGWSKRNDIITWERKRRAFDA